MRVGLHHVRANTAALRPAAIVQLGQHALACAHGVAESHRVAARRYRSGWGG